MKKIYKAPEVFVEMAYASEYLLMTMSSYNEDDLPDDDFMEFDDPILWGDDKIGKGGWGEA